MNTSAIRRTLALTSTAVALTALAQAPASAEPTPIPATRTTTTSPTGEGTSYIWLYFNIKRNSRFVQVKGASKQRGAVTELWDFRRGAHQKWTISKSYSGKYSFMHLIKNQNSGMCLNVRGASKKAGTRVIQWPCSSKHLNSLWVWKRSYGRGDQRLFNANSGLCLAVGKSSPSDGAHLVQMPCRKGWESQRIFIG